MTAETAQKERPILFSAPMVRAILEERKTQTRRVIKPMRGWEKKYPTCKPEAMAYPWSVWWHGDITDRVGVSQDCPYGVPGDHLWVREGWLPFDPDHVMQGKRWAYVADTVIGSDGDRCRKDFGYKWRPSIFMPREASRITLEITGVRVERVQNISEADATAEGTQEPSLSDLGGMLKQAAWSERQVYQRLWDHINGTREGYAWKDNPWVWVVEFRRISQ